MVSIINFFVIIIFAVNNAKFGFGSVFADTKLTKAVKKTWHRLLERHSFTALFLSFGFAQINLTTFSFCRKTKSF